jgi:hypothetical protein
MTSQSASVRRPLAILAALVGVLVIVSLVVVFTRGEPELFDESTPEGIVQRYSAAVLKEDEDAALEYLAEETRVDCGTVAGTENANLRITLVGTEYHGQNDVDVTVSLSRGSSGPFDGSGYEYEEAFSLTQVDGDWRIVTAPWELAFCRNDGFSE